MNVRTIFPKTEKKNSGRIWEAGRYSGILSSAYVQEALRTEGREEQAEETVVCYLPKSHRVHNRTLIGTVVWGSDGREGARGYSGYTEQDRIGCLLHDLWA